MKAKFLGASTCDHEWAFIFSSHLTSTDGSHRYEAHVCQNCGLFRIHGHVHQRPIDIRFTLNTPELVAAAGAYLPLIENEQITE